MVSAWNCLTLRRIGWTRVQIAYYYGLLFPVWLRFEHTHRRRVRVANDCETSGFAWVCISGARVIRNPNVNKYRSVSTEQHLYVGPTYVFTAYSINFTKTLVLGNKLSDTVASRNVFTILERFQQRHTYVWGYLRLCTFERQWKSLVFFEMAVDGIFDFHGKAYSM